MFLAALFFFAYLESPAVVAGPPHPTAALAPALAVAHPHHMSSSSDLSPTALRRHYQKSATDKAAGEAFYNLLADYAGTDALVLGYKGASLAIRARDASMFSKLTYVQDAAKAFDQAVGLDAKNPEIRFLRFSIESNLPPFLGMSKHLDEDKALLLQAALAHPKSGLDAEAFGAVRGFLVARGHVSEADAARLGQMAE